MPPKLLPNGQPLGDPNREPAPQFPPHVQPSHNPTMSHRQQMQPPNRQQAYNAMPHGFLEGFATVVDDKIKRQLTPYFNAAIQKAFDEAKATMANDIRKAVREEMKPVILSCRKLGFEIQEVQSQIARLARGVPQPARASIPKPALSSAPRPVPTSAPQPVVDSAPQPTPGSAPQPALEAATQSAPPAAPQPAPRSATPAPGSGPGHATSTVPAPAPASLPSGSPRTPNPAPAGAMARAPTPFAGPSNAQAGGLNPAANGAQGSMSPAGFNFGQPSGSQGGQAAPRQGAAQPQYGQPAQPSVAAASAHSQAPQNRAAIPNVMAGAAQRQLPLTVENIARVIQSYLNGVESLEAIVRVLGQMGLPANVSHVLITAAAEARAMSRARQAQQYQGGNFARGPMQQTFMNAPGAAGYAPNAAAYAPNAAAYAPNAAAYTPNTAAHAANAAAYTPNVAAYAAQEAAYAARAAAFAPAARPLASAPVATYAPNMQGMNQRPAQGLPAPAHIARIQSGSAAGQAAATPGPSSAAFNASIKNEPIEHRIKPEPRDGDVKMEADGNVKREPGTTPASGPVVGTKRAREDDEDSDSDSDEGSALVLHTPGAGGSGGLPSAKRTKFFNMQMTIKGDLSMPRVTFNSDVPLQELLGGLTGSLTSNVTNVTGSLTNNLATAPQRPQNWRQARNRQQKNRSRR